MSKRLSARTLGNTVTGEPFQPARVYHDVLDKDATLAAFKALGCLDFDESRGRWVWLYSREAKKLELAIPYKKLPRQAHARW